jgi:hypothetical protein
MDRSVIGVVYSKDVGTVSEDSNRHVSTEAGKDKKQMPAGASVCVSSSTPGYIELHHQLRPIGLIGILRLG